ncbi:MAG: hypothetical protein ACHQT8_01470 [Chlamydiales bacterium]
MSLPANFSRAPGEEPGRNFRNLCIKFQKLIKTSQDSEELQRMMEEFINESREMNWHHKTSDRFQKDVGEKMTGKVFTEFKRYVDGLGQNPPVNPQDLLDAIVVVEQYVRSFKVT